MWDNNNSLTKCINDKISRCEDLDEFKNEIIPILKSQREQWQDKIKQIINENKFTNSYIAEAVGLSGASVGKWIKGAVPRHRETFIKIGLLANYNREELDQLLVRYGRFPALYSKSLEDCVCLYVLHNKSDVNNIDRYYYILNRINEKIIRNELSGNEEIPTEEFEKKLLSVHSEEALEQFIMENIDAFGTAYNRFYGYIIIYFEDNLKKKLKGNFEKDNNKLHSTNLTELANGQGWSSSLKQTVSNIRQKKWYPTRNKIISLGIHLSMNCDDINELLAMVYMEPLCAKNIFESAIIYVLENASLEGMLDMDREDFNPDALCEYTKNIFEQLELSEIDFFLSELPERGNDE